MSKGLRLPASREGGTRGGGLVSALGRGSMAASATASTNASTPCRFSQGIPFSMRALDGMGTSGGGSVGKERGYNVILKNSHSQLFDAVMILYTVFVL